MSRNSRLWQSPLAFAAVYEGDITTCAIWRSWAMVKLKFMLKNHPGSTTATFDPVPDVFIRVDTRPNKIYIRADIGSVYLESGFFDLLSSAVCAENTYKPAILHYNSKIAAYITSSLPKPIQGGVQIKSLEGERLADGYASHSVGGKHLAKSVTDPCGTTYSASVVTYVQDTQKVLMQKQVQNRIPASMFSGKMRLFVQALYGSERTDYRINVGENGLPVPGDYNLYLTDLYDKDFLLTWDYPYTCGIYTTTDYKYYLLKVVTNEIKVYPLKLSAAGEKLRAKMLSVVGTQPASDLAKLEAYLLSTCKIDTLKMTTVTIAGAPSIAGGPLAYGWKFSRSGKKCTVVIHEDTSALSNRTFFTAHEITVSITELAGVFSATVSNHRTGTWYWSTYFVAWAPEFFTYSQYQFGNFNYDAYPTTGAAPLYGWYEDETYQTVDVNINVQHLTNIYDEGDMVVTPGCGGQDISYKSRGTYNGPNGVIGLSGKVTTSMNVMSNSSRFEKEYYWTAYGAWSVPDTGIPLTGGVFDCSSSMGVLDYLVSIGAANYVAPNYFLTWNDTGDPDYLYATTFRYRVRYVRYNYYAVTTESASANLGIIIPLLDSESIVTINNATYGVSAANTWYGAYDHGTAMQYQVEYLNVKKMKASPYTVSIVDSLGIQSGNVLVDGSGSSSAGTSSGWVYGIDTGTATMDIAAYTTGAFSVTEDGYNIKSTTGNAASTAWSDAYLAATFGSNLGGDTVLIKASYNGANITYHGEGTGENKNGYPYDNAVGWA